jgi:hypothetical protein
MQVSVGQAGHVKIKLGDGLVPVSGRKINVMMNFLKLTTCWFAPAMKPNGPAVWLVAVCACPDDRQVVRVAVAWFLPSPGRWTSSFSSRLKCPDG